MKSDILLQQIADAADALWERTDKVSVLLARAISRDVQLYRAAAPVSFDVLTTACAANMRSIFAAIAADADFNPAAATRSGPSGQETACRCRR